MLFDYAVPGTNKLAFTTNFHYTGKRYVDEMNTASVSGYFTTDLGVRYTTKAWIGKETSIRFNVNNVFDKKYWVSIFSGDLDGSVPSSYSGASMFRGYGRTFMLSAQVKF
jgi:tonB-dependent receptor domain protein